SPNILTCYPIPCLALQEILEDKSCAPTTSAASSHAAFPRTRAPSCASLAPPSSCACPPAPVMPTLVRIGLSVLAPYSRAVARSSLLPPSCRASSPPARVPRTPLLHVPLALPASPMFTRIRPCAPVAHSRVMTDRSFSRCALFACVRFHWSCAITRLHPPSVLNSSYTAPPTFRAPCASTPMRVCAPFLNVHFLACLYASHTSSYPPLRPCMRRFGPIFSLLGSSRPLALFVAGVRNPLLYHSPPLRDFSCPQGIILDCPNIGHIFFDHVHIPLTVLVDLYQHLAIVNNHLFICTISRV
ncbi:Unknown protein, partial [Striga hermonthica]